MYSVIIGDKVCDVTYKRYSDFGWVVWLNGKKLATLFNMKNLGWDAVIYKDSTLSTVHTKGFMNRAKALQHTLEVLGYHLDDSKYEFEHRLYEINLKYGKKPTS